MSHYKPAQGYTLIELLVAVLLSAALITGVSFAYVTITDLVKTNKNLENAQEVIRYTSEIFTRSLKQTSAQPVIAMSGAQLTVAHDAEIIACNGIRQNNSFNEVYTLANNQLMCNVGGTGAQAILTGLESITFAKDANQQILSITIEPQAQQGEASNTGPTAPMQIDVALSEIILVNALSSASGT